MAVNKLLAAAGAVGVLVLSVTGHQHGVRQRTVAVTSADNASENTPWTDGPAWLLVSPEGGRRSTQGGNDVSPYAGGPGVVQYPVPDRSRL